MMADQRKCPIEGCAVHIDGGHLMCKAHWLKVPGWLRRKITTAWRHYRAIRRSTDHAEVMAAIRAHRVVADEAVAFVQAMPVPADPAFGMEVLMPSPYRPQAKGSEERALSRLRRLTQTVA